MAREVEETKQLILRRLDELRARRTAVDELPADSARPAPRAARQSPRRWLRDRARDELPERVQRVEERVASLERLFVESPRAAALERASSRAAAGRVVQLAAGGQPAGARAATSPPFDDPSYQLTGDVENGLLPDVLQLLAANQKTGRFSLFVPSENERFDLFFVDGEIVHAKAGDAQGEAAFFSLMVTAQQRGTYGFVAGVRPDCARTIDAKAEFLILEALRRIDEERHQAGAAGAGG